MSQKFYPGSARNWSTLDTVQLQFGSATATFTGNRSIHTPAEYSYHCQSVNSFQDPLLVKVNSTGNSSNWRLNFVDFQVQLHAFWMYPSVFVCHYWIVITDIVFSHLDLSCAIDSGLWPGQFRRFLLRQRLRRLLLRWDLDGAADYTDFPVDFRVRPADDREFKHNGSIWWPKGSNDFSASVRVTRSHSSVH